MINWNPQGFVLIGFRLVTAAVLGYTTLVSAWGSSIFSSAAGQVAGRYPCHTPDVDIAAEGLTDVDFNSSLFWNKCRGIHLGALVLCAWVRKWAFNMGTLL